VLTKSIKSKFKRTKSLPVLLILSCYLL
jgi:hypothetical protein